MTAGAWLAALDVPLRAGCPPTIRAGRRTPFRRPAPCEEPSRRGGHFLRPMHAVACTFETFGVAIGGIHELSQAVTFLGRPHVGSARSEPLSLPFGSGVEGGESRSPTGDGGLTLGGLLPRSKSRRRDATALGDVAAHVCEANVRRFVCAAGSSRKRMSVGRRRPLGVPPRRGRLEGGASIGASAYRHRAFETRYETKPRGLDQNGTCAECGQFIREHLTSPGDIGGVGAYPRQATSTEPPATQQLRVAESGRPSEQFISRRPVIAGVVPSERVEHPAAGAPIVARLGFHPSLQTESPPPRFWRGDGHEGAPPEQATHQVYAVA